MATQSPYGGFVDLTPYRQGLGVDAVNPLESLIQGFTQGQAIRNIPQTIEQQRQAQLQDELGRRLNIAIQQQKLQSLPLEQQKQALLIEQLKAEMDPGYAAKQNDAKIKFATDQARALANVQKEFAPVVTPKNSILSPGQRLIDPEGKEITSVPTTDKDSKPISVTPGSKVIDSQGNVIFDNPLAPKTKEATPVHNPVNGEIMGFMIDGAFKSNKQLGTAGASGAPNVGSKQFLIEMGKNAITVIDDLNSRTSRMTVGFGSLTKIIPESPALDYAADLETLAADIKLGILFQMKSLSKTGASGLGQLSDREGKTLESALGSLKQDQSPSNVKKNLKKIRESVVRWNEGVSSAKPEDFGGAPSAAKDSLGLFQ